VLSTLAAESGEAPHSLNLRDFHSKFALAGGKILALSVTNQPKEIDHLVKPQPERLRRPDLPTNPPKIQVYFGRDLVGVAELSGLSSSRAAKPSERLTKVQLTFASPEQATRAAELMRLPNVAATPLAPRTKAN